MRHVAKNALWYLSASLLQTSDGPVGTDLSANSKGGTICREHPSKLVNGINRQYECK